MNIIGVIGALLIGVVLGLIGAGGSILTVPIFVYILDISPVQATAYSLFVVGVAALFGAIKNTKEKLVDYKTGLVFAFPAFLGVYISRKFLLNLMAFTFLNSNTIFFMILQVLSLLPSSINKIKEFLSITFFLN